MTPQQQTLDFDEQLHLVDLFAGPGGLDVAAHWLGIVADGVEWDAGACATRRAAGLGTWQNDVRQLGPEDFPSATILTGGPPCQTYTVAGGGAGRRALDQVLGFVKRMAAGEDVRPSLEDLEDERTALVLEPLRWALRAKQLERPYQTIVLEQVPAVLPVWEAMEEALEGIGYKSTSGILHTEEYGVPQTRRRAILIAKFGVKEKPELPTPTHRRFRRGDVRSAAVEEKLSRWVAMGQALERTDEFVVVSNYGTGGNPKARGRRRFDEPSATVTGKISRNRLETLAGKDLPRLDFYAAGRLQTFPQDYPWAGKDVSQQIGNAIPPRLAAHVLAAALDLVIDPRRLDEAVRGSWEKFDNTRPVAVRKAVVSDDVDAG
ncbi:DNA cytosine methyltransferase [Amycolatopsis rubida]|uniref:DNA (cytosine-5-)-methyltransferase n=1 Tax=Amycolatopsis rubida TaxID=112413 RepID=A0A1I5W8I4_9PSEU|nr:DNA cytosine methyltransferase [Amycolatopsis rubida]SFQ16059.1 DNA (cytosine-5)-methyltransferase 1 [Amycolatopsis rubida]